MVSAGWPSASHRLAVYDPVFCSYSSNLPISAGFQPVSNAVPVFAPAEVEYFERNGFVIARGLASRERCERMKAVAQRDLAAEVGPLEYEAQVKYPGSPASVEAPGGRTVRRRLQAYARDSLFREWAIAPEMSARLRQLLGPDLELSQTHHNCIMTKNPAFSSATGWHQDIRYWSFEKPGLG